MVENVLTQFEDAGTTLAMSQNVQTTPPGIHYAQYETKKEAEYLPQIRELISNDLSEPYSIYVYRYFLYQWADLCFMVCYRLPSMRKSSSVLTSPGSRRTQRPRWCRYLQARTSPWRTHERLHRHACDKERAPR